MPGFILLKKQKFTPSQIVSNVSSVEGMATIPTLGGDGWFMMGTIGDYRLLFSAMMTTASPQWRVLESATCKAPDDMKNGKVVVITRNELSQLQTTLTLIGTGVTPATLSPAKDDALYNLAGQRVARRSDVSSGKVALRPGVYVTAGKKVTIK